MSRFDVETFSFARIYRERNRIAYSIAINPERARCMSPCMSQRDFGQVPAGKDWLQAGAETLE